MLVFSREQNSWDEIGKAFADAGSCFSDKMLALAKRSRDGASHFHLFRSILVVTEPPRNATTWAQDVIYIK